MVQSLVFALRYVYHKTLSLNVLIPLTLSSQWIIGLHLLLVSPSGRLDVCRTLGLINGLLRRSISLN